MSIFKQIAERNEARQQAEANKAEQIKAAAERAFAELVWKSYDEAEIDPDDALDILEAAGKTAQDLIKEVNKIVAYDEAAELAPQLESLEKDFTDKLAALRAHEKTYQEHVDKFYEKTRAMEAAMKEAQELRNKASRAKYHLNETKAAMIPRP